MSIRIDSALNSMPHDIRREFDHEVSSRRRGTIAAAVLPLNDALLSRQERIDVLQSKVERLTDDFAAATHLLADRDVQIERLMAELATLRAATASVQTDQRAEIDAARAQIERLTADLAAANAVIDAACGALHGEGVCDQGEAWDKALDLLDAARVLRKGTT